MAAPMWNDFQALTNALLDLNEKPGFLYHACCHDDRLGQPVNSYFFKIGCTNDVLQRDGEHRRQCWDEEVELLVSYKTQYPQHLGK